ncbi:hypothetical protein DYGSA30_46440 [Dyella sp. GSA-30]|nr:hypothetical protein DYGSA30_46440 [Dyella sp. GSA-30]
MALISGFFIANQPANAGVVLNGTRFIYAYQLAAWRLRGHLHEDRGDIWTRVANYHSRTPRFNERYRAQLMRRAYDWEQWLSAQFPVRIVNEIAKAAE